jgi:hypothetical protein
VTARRAVERGLLTPEQARAITDALAASGKDGSE